LQREVLRREIEVVLVDPAQRRSRGPVKKPPDLVDRRSLDLVKQRCARLPPEEEKDSQQVWTTGITAQAPRAWYRLKSNATSEPTLARSSEEAKCTEAERHHGRGLPHSPVLA
jgi:hypothetical protein